MLAPNSGPLGRPSTEGTSPSCFNSCCFVFHLGWSGVRVEQTPGTPPPPPSSSADSRVGCVDCTQPDTQTRVQRDYLRRLQPGALTRPSALGTGSRDSQLNFLFVVGFLLCFCCCFSPFKEL